MHYHQIQCEKSEKTECALINQLIKSLKVTLAHGLSGCDTHILTPLGRSPQDMGAGGRSHGQTSLTSSAIPTRHHANLDYRADGKSLSPVHSHWIRRTIVPTRCAHWMCTLSAQEGVGRECAPSCAEHGKLRVYQLSKRIMHVSHAMYVSHAIYNNIVVHISHVMY